MTLKEVAVGGKATIVRLTGEGAVKRAPIGDPIELSVRGYSLSIRKSEAETIEVKS